MDFARLGWLLDLLPYRHAPLVYAALGKRRLILDVGGGTGRVACRLSSERVVVVDPEPALLARARARRLPAVRADARHLPFRDGSAPAMVMVDALHHMPDHARVLAEARRVLAPAGRLVIEEFDPQSLGGKLVSSLEGLAGFGSRFHRPAALAALAREAGLVARIERWSGRDYALVAECSES